MVSSFLQFKKIETLKKKVWIFFHLVCYYKKTVINIFSNIYMTRGVRMKMKGQSKQ